jgi:hypothetical protein
MTGFRANHGDIEAKGFAAILLSRCHDNRIVCGEREKSLGANFTPKRKEDD